MTKRFHSVKKLPIWIAISAVVIIAGIILYALLGFNFATSSASVEVKFDALYKQETLQNFCEDAFKSAGLGYKLSSVSEERDPNTLGSTRNYLLVYTFDGDVAESSLASAVSAISSKIDSDTDFSTTAEASVSYHLISGENFYEATWRGAIALGVGAIVALVYIGFRFGIDSALAGLVSCVHDALFALALLAIVRIPVYPYTPLLFAGLAVAFSLILWIVRSAKMREDFKDPSFAPLSAEEAVEESCAGSLTAVLFIAAAFAAMLILFGAIATEGLRLFMLPALIPLAASLYSSLLLAPAVYAPIKAKFDRIKTKQKRYVGKKKADSAQAE